MKKLSALFLSATLLLSLSGCGVEQKPELKVYSFSGKNEVCSISDGVAVISEDYETLYGGKLEVSEGDFQDITSYTMTFFVGEEPVLSHAAADTTGSFELAEQQIGQITGDVFSKEAEEKLEQNFFFELKTQNDKGETNTFTIPMEVREITGK